MNPRLDLTHPYPFERLRALLTDIEPPAGVRAVPLSLGEPRHPPPQFVVDALVQADALTTDLGHYPPTRGSDALRIAIADWLARRFELGENRIDPDRHILPVNGTREALFAIAQLIVDPHANALVALPNPFYQIYEGAALLAGAEPRYLPCTEATGFLPDLDAMSASDWRRCELLYVCSPGNPTGAVMNQDTFTQLLELADRHDFIIASDECYSEIYIDEDAPPPGLLQAAAASSRSDFERCIVFHSLSKRSSLPGLRSGFVAGDANLIERFLHYRTYHGCAMPPAAQRASALAWGDEAHVQANRRAYREKFEAVVPLLAPHMEVHTPPAGFYLWPRTPIPDEAFTRALLASTGVTVLPGSYLARTDHGSNPGANHVRMALVATPADCVEAATRIARMLASQPR